MIMTWRPLLMVVEENGGREHALRGAGTKF